MLLKETLRIVNFKSVVSWYEYFELFANQLHYCYLRMPHEVLTSDKYLIVKRFNYLKGTLTCTSSEDCCMHVTE